MNQTPWTTTLSGNLPDTDDVPCAAMLKDRNKTTTAKEEFQCSFDLHNENNVQETLEIQHNLEEVCDLISRHYGGNTMSSKLSTFTR